MYMYLLFLVVFMIFFIKAVSMSHSKYFIHAAFIESHVSPLYKGLQQLLSYKEPSLYKELRLSSPYQDLCVLSHYKRLLLLCPSEANCCRPRRLWSRARGTTLSAGCAEAWTGAWTW